MQSNRRGSATIIYDQGDEFSTSFLAEALIKRPETRMIDRSSDAAVLVYNTDLLACLRGYILLLLLLLSEDFG